MGWGGGGVKKKKAICGVRGMDIFWNLTLHKGDGRNVPFQIYV